LLRRSSAAAAGSPGASGRSGATGSIIGNNGASAVEDAVAARRGGTAEAAEPRGECAPRRSAAARSGAAGAAAAGIPCRPLGRALARAAHARSACMAEQHHGPVRPGAITALGGPQLYRRMRPSRARRPGASLSSRPPSQGVAWRGVWWQQLPRRTSSTRAPPSQPFSVAGLCQRQLVERWPVARLRRCCASCSRAPRTRRVAAAERHLRLRPQRAARRAAHDAHPRCADLRRLQHAQPAVGVRVLRHLHVPRVQRRAPRPGRAHQLCAVRSHRVSTPRAAPAPGGVACAYRRRAHAPQPGAGPSQWTRGRRSS
jgi:hypothetical protein